MIQIENQQAHSTDGKHIHRIGSDTYFRRGTVLQGETEADFEEVDAVPSMTKAEYDARVAALVRQRYSESEEFAIQRKAMNLLLNPEPVNEEGFDPTQTLAEFNAYNAYVEQCKLQAKDPN